MAASSEHNGLGNNYTEDRDMWWASNYQTQSSSSEPPPSFSFSGLPLAGILSIYLACYLLVVFLLTSLHSCSTRQCLAAECCLSEPDTTCSDICSDLCATCSQCCSCRCSCSISSCTKVLQYYVLDECRMYCNDCVGALQDVYLVLLTLQRRRSVFMLPVSNCKAGQTRQKTAAVRQD